MAKTRTGGIFVWPDGSRSIDKRYKGERIFLRLGKVSQDEAERRLGDELRAREAAKQIARNHSTLFADCAARFLIESQAKRTAELLAYHVQLLLPFIGTLDISQVHDGTLDEFKASRRAEGVSATTINRSLEVVRTVLNCAARSWRDEIGEPWLKIAPPLLTMETENRRPAHPISWEEQDVLLPELPLHLQTMTLFGLNTGLRDENICGLRWAWEVPVPEVKRSVFIVPAAEFKTDVDHVLILNDAAWRIVEQQREARKIRMEELGAEEDAHPYVFTYKDHRVGAMNNSAWDKGRIRAAMKLHLAAGKKIPSELVRIGQRGQLLTPDLKDYMLEQMPGFANLRVHDLRHTYAARLRLAGVPQEDRNALLGHKSASIPEHYASADIGRLIELANRALDRQGTRTLLRVVSR